MPVLDPTESARDFILVPSLDSATDVLETQPAKNANARIAKRRLKSGNGMLFFMIGISVFGLRAWRLLGVKVNEFGELF